MILLPRANKFVKCCISNIASSPKCKLATIAATSKSANVSRELENWDRGGRKDKSIGNGKKVRKEEINFTPLYASMKRLIDSNPGCVSLIQVGSFYEMHFDQAEEYGPKLGLKVAYKKTSNHVIPMAGFPLSQLKKFMEMLIHDHEVSVAIIDQYNNLSKTNQNLIHRKVSRIVSPGTLIDESFLNFNQNNFMLSISLPPNMMKQPADPDMIIGLAWVDVSVGDTFVQQTTLGNLISDISRINPSEILISKEYMESSKSFVEWFPPLQELRRYFVRFHNTQYSDLKLQFKATVPAVRKALEDLSVREQSALNLALSYVNVNLPDADSLLDLPIRYHSKESLQMDSRTREALELTERGSGRKVSASGTLLSTIRRTCTSSGSRLLIQWLNSPLLNVKKIQERQNYVKLFLSENHLRLGVKHRLQRIADFIRIVQKLSAGTGDDITNLKQIADTLIELRDLKLFLEEFTNNNIDKSEVLLNFTKQFDIPLYVAETINDAIIQEELNNIDVIDNSAVGQQRAIDDDEAEFEEDDLFTNNFMKQYRIREDEESVSQSYFVIRPDYNEELKKLHVELGRIVEKENEFLQDLLKELQQYDPKLTISKKDQLGKLYNVLAISGKVSSIKKIAHALHRDVLSQKKTTLVYRPAMWNTLQQELHSKQDLIKEIENEIIQNLRNVVINEIPKLRLLAKAVDFLDVTSSFATIAEENDWVCPSIVESSKLRIQKGRHVVVESSLKSSGNMFTSNDLSLSATKEKLWVVTGPNMGGKSTFLRQNALIVILAQAGSFVPAEKATIGVVDKVFTRIGASDDLYNDLSTFMVEMIETSNILTHATSKSLAIVDEIGRGTSGKEGLAIAYATLVTLLKKNKCRTLFATHFGVELDKLLKSSNEDQSLIKFYRTRVLKPKNEQEAAFIDHTLEPGISERSYAFEVAKKAGFPNFALEEAETIYSKLSISPY
ncbi:uncharacterized protein KGF55_003511 [Candida pseudojiufengensis]|uniref:uncharacterized protein n=1 Tax=Candida pseudojiufengensis TaxID=497109 RepID=UPI00222427A4|nr:uncharacterized protein KGF55_003511 [Candida pseudojiufengensis]KAI5962435.1 hypothetical protein KGF55_003511 [Candida pseudojiufengensis]